MILLLDGGDSRGFAGDSRGIRRHIGGFAMFSMTLGPRFGGIRPRQLRSFIILKKGKEDAWGVWAPMGLGYRGEALPSVQTF